MLSIQTNMLAWNASGQFKVNAKKTAKNAEKLSSGFKVNRSADDAAGLVISEAMRRQIRGLRQGSDNIQEGISMVQVADGALDEVVDMLQRINELSVKAYNGTNTMEDRNYIQEEVTHLIKEIERVADTTTFNEIFVLKGNPTETTMTVIEPDKVYTEYLTLEVEREVPDWLKSGVDGKLEIHNAYKGLTQDYLEGVMFQTTKFDKDGHIVEGVYYGPYQGDVLHGVYKYGGQWSTTLDDNPTAKISFSGLAMCDDTTQLYTNMLDLLGCAIGVPCGTCSSQYYGIGFKGEVDGYSAAPSSHTNNGIQVGIKGMLDVSSWTGFTDDTGKAVNCFDKIKELAQKQSSDTTSTEAEKKAKVRELAAEIAQKLCAKTYETITKVTDYKKHFDRAITNGVYDIIVYDYRDKAQLDKVHASDALVSVAASGTTTIPYSSLKPGTAILKEEDNPLKIVCSSQSGDWIPIDLPLISADTLGITGYDVSRYTVKETYSEAYKAKLEAWENSGTYELITIPAHTEKYNEAKLISNTPIYKNGELVKYDSVYEFVPKERYVPESQVWSALPKEPRPEPEEGDILRTISYDPDSNRQIADALRYVLDCRTVLGAQQNRLEHSYNNNQNKLENTSAAESCIRDMDVSEEIMSYSKNNILLQSVTSMLSQANQSSELILQLLQ